MTMKMEIVTIMVAANMAGTVTGTMAAEVLADDC